MKRLVSRRGSWVRPFIALILIVIFILILFCLTDDYD